MRYFALATTGSLALLAASASAGNSAGVNSAILATQVITFHPAAPKGPERRGHCWTDSIAVDRPAAWRCMAGNAIHDPCFTNPELKDAVICGADPARDERGFILKLTKPLPAPTSRRLPNPRPWLLKLADGSICGLSTGTIALVSGQEVPYGCSDSHKCTNDGCPYMTGLTSNLKRAKVWIAEKVAYRSSKTGLELLKRESIPVVAVWK